MDAEIPLGLCQCGCGGLTRTPKWNDAAHGRVGGVPFRFLYPPQEKRRRRGIR